MIEIYVGAPGSGKSYHALRRGLTKVNARTRNVVVANFDIIKRTKREKENWIFLEEFEPEDLIKLSFERKFYGIEGFALLIIDEAGVWFNSRDWMVNPGRRKEWIKFFSQSRKFGYDVVLITQDVRMLDRQIRNCSEYVVKHVKLRNYIWLKWLPLPMFCYVSFWQGGAFRGTPQVDVFLPWVARRYDSMKLFKVTDEVRKLAKEYGICLE